MTTAPATAAGMRPHDQGVGDEELAARYATVTVLITASRATDVEQAARRIHAASARGTAPLVLFPAAGLPTDVATFTGRWSNLLDAARNGTLLLTGVEEMPAVVQERMIENIARLQGSRERAAAVRVMAGTTASLRERVADGTFSARLFYRLNPIHVVVKGSEGEAGRKGPAPSR